VKSPKNVVLICGRNSPIDMDLFVHRCKVVLRFYNSG
jgi:hypothetical protein